MTKIVNFFGGPGAGKSTMAAKLFGWMKAERMNCEYVPEFAKDLTWRKSESIDDQIYLFGEQHHRLYTLFGQVDYVITDSPLALSLFYGGYANKKFAPGAKKTFWKSTFSDFVMSTISHYDNVNFEVIRGDRKYITQGRNQTEDEAKKIDNDLNMLLTEYNIGLTRVETLEEVLTNLNLGG